jgi:hypothetical protein
VPADRRWSVFVSRTGAWSSRAVATKPRIKDCKPASLPRPSISASSIRSPANQRSPANSVVGPIARALLACRLRCRSRILSVSRDRCEGQPARYTRRRGETNMRVGSGDLAGLGAGPIEAHTPPAMPAGRNGTILRSMAISPWPLARTSSLPPILSPHRSPPLPCSLARPLGGILFGHIGDRIGRKRALTASVALMGVATVLIGLLPTHAQIGVVAGAALVLLRLMRVWPSAASSPPRSLIAVERAHAQHCGWDGSWMSVGAVGGTLLGSAVGALISSVIPARSRPGLKGRKIQRFSFVSCGSTPAGGVRGRRRVRGKPQACERSPRLAATWGGPLDFIYSAVAADLAVMLMSPVPSRPPAMNELKQRIAGRMMGAGAWPKAHHKQEGKPWKAGAIAKH